MDISFQTLGALEVNSMGKSYAPCGPKTRQVLALLVLKANSVVSTDSIVDELWGDSPPRSVTTTLQTYIYQVRKAFRREFPGHEINGSLVTSPPGYKLSLPECCLDGHQFERLVRQGQLLLDQGRFEKALWDLESALSLWKGDVLEDVRPGRKIQGYAVRMEEMRISALQLRIVAEMKMGRSHEIISDLRTLTELHPINEWFHGQLMSALAKAGRRGEALEVYQSLRGRLDDDLGLEPSAEIKRFQVDILKDSEHSRDLGGKSISVLDIAAIGRF